MAFPKRERVHSFGKGCSKGLAGSISKGATGAGVEGFMSTETECVLVTAESPAPCTMYLVDAQ